MFMGEYHHNIDDKNRLIIPSKFRDELGDEFIITRGIDACLFVYSKSSFQKIVDKLETLPFTKKDARNFNRFFLSGATAVELDKQGRAGISQTLTNYAALDKECVVIGVGDRLEIWAKENWDNFYNSAKDNMSDIAENLFDGGLDLWSI